MKKFSDFSEEINKCSNCGKCQEICPIYKLTGNDCAVSKGKFIMLKGVLKGDLRFSKTVEKYLDICLRCGKCSDFCPSGIDACEIFNYAKSECLERSFSGKFIKFLQSEQIYSNLLKLGKIFKRKKYSYDGVTKLLYFKGCVNELFPSCENAVKKILNNYDVQLIEKDFDCCGLPFLSSGNIERYEVAKQRNLKLLESDYNYIITDCASCESTISKYNNDLKVINVCRFLADQNKKFVFDKSYKVTYHKPCHLKDDSFLKPLFAKCENVEYIEARNYDDCCGFAGEFGLKNAKLSSKMIKNKVDNLLDTGADIVLTSCPSCILGIKKGLLGRGQTKVMNIVEFLAMAKIV